MKQNNIYIGKIINTFGIKGELKIYSESDFIEHRYRKGAKIYIDNKEHIVSSFRIHQNLVLITIDEIKDEILNFMKGRKRC